MIGIYKITNKVNGKVYIGQSIDIKRRLYQHKHPSMNSTHPLHKDIISMGVEEFDFEVLLLCPADMLSVWEKDMINLFESNITGYNIHTNNTFGSQYRKKNSLLHNQRISSSKLHHTVSDVTKSKISKSLTGFRHTNETKQKISNGLKGRSVSQETREKIKNSQYRRKQYNWMTPDGKIVQMSLCGVKQWHPDWTLVNE